MVGEELSLFAQRDHAHLVLAAALPPEPRRKISPGGGRGLAYPDRARHARDLQSQSKAVRARHAVRPAVLGVQPELVVVLELSRPLKPDDVEHAGLQVLEATEVKAMAAFASDPELTEFLHRSTRYGGGVPPDGKSAPYEDLFDSIARVRLLEPADVLDPDLLASLASVAESEPVRLDVQCWCPEDEAETHRRFEETKRAVLTAGGSVLDSSCRYAVGLSLIRVELAAGRVPELAETTRVRRISRLPRPLLSTPAVVRARFDDLPPVLPPAPGAPLFAVIDSGVRGTHPLLATALVEATVVNEQAGGASDENGHGTLVASLALYGSLESRLHRREPLRPAGRLISIRVLDQDGHFPDARIWQEDLTAAIIMAAERKARVVNISLGDIRQPYHPPGPVPVAAIVDVLAKDLGLVIVLSAGNMVAGAYPGDPAVVIEYPRLLLDLPDTGLLPPAMAALGLTVGALVGEYEQGQRRGSESVDVVPMGKPRHPSAITRVGPGIENATKPELVAVGGGFSYDHGRQAVVDDHTGRVVGAGGVEPDRLLASAGGTSYAAPLVTHAALRVLGRYPQLSANAVRALVLASADPTPAVVSSSSPTESAVQQRRLTGFGQASALRAAASSDHRAVLLAEGELVVDEVHFYVLPIPSSFLGPGRKWIKITLAHDPAVRATRLSYLANRMSVFAYRGVDVDEVRAKYAAHLSAGEDDAPARFPGRQTIDLQPAAATSCLGANQAVLREYGQRWDASLCGQQIVVAVRNTNRWAPAGTQQTYALAVVLETEEHAAPLYDELHAQLQALAEVQPEIEVG